MTEERNTYRRPLKIVAIVAASLLMLAVIIRLSLMTGLVRDQVRKLIVNQSAGFINGELSIGSLEGDLWKELTMLNVDVTMDGDTLFHADTVAATYHVPDLLGSRTEIAGILLSDARIRLRESDKEFNVQQLIKEQETADDEDASGRPVQIREIRVKETSMDLYSPSYLPDSTLSVENLNLRASAELSEELKFGLDKLEFRLREGRLPELLDISLAGQMEDEQVTLEKLAIRTGRSLLEANARVDLADSSLQAEADLSPLALADLAPYLEQDLRDLRISIESELSGNPSSLRFRLQADHPAIREVDLGVTLAMTQEPVLKELTLKIRSMELGALSDSIPDIRTGRVDLSMNGSFKTEWQQSEGTWSANVRELIAMDQELESIVINGNIKQEAIRTDLSIQRSSGERIVSGARITSIESNEPDWELVANAEGLDLNSWLEEPVFPTDINGWVTASGSGFSLTDEMWTYRLLSSEEPDERWKLLQRIYPEVLGDAPGMLVLDDQPIGGLSLEGSISSSLAEAKGQVRLGRSNTDIEVSVQEFLSARPDFQYALRTQEFNAADLKGFSGFPTYLNLSLAGNGRGRSMDGLELYTELEADSSIVNGAALDNVNAVLDLKDGIISLTRGILESEILEGTFTGRKNLLDQSDPDNRLSLDLRVKNIQPLAPLLQAEELNAVGSWKGDITQNEKGELAGKFDLDLEEVRFDSLFTADGIDGSVDLAFQNIVQFNAFAELRSPVISGILLQDVQLNADGRAGNDSLNTEFSLNVKGSTEGRFTQQGNITLHMPTGDLELYLTGMEILTDESALILKRGFSASRRNGVIRTDTLHLADAVDSTYLKIAVPYADSLRQEGWLEGEAFDFGLTQEVLFGKKFVDGILSGDLSFDRDGNDLTGICELKLDQILYEGVAFDSLTFRNSLKNRRLSGQAAAWWAGERHLFADLSVPLALLAEDLNDAFFRSKVDGTLEISDVDLVRFEPLMSRIGYNSVLGMLNMNATIRGTAEKPALEGELNWSKPVISGINLDKITAGIDYDSDQSEVILTGNVLAGGQQAAVLSAEVPLSYDFRSLKLITPEENDTVAIDLNTKAFNLAVFNGFLDPEYTRNLKGQIDAELQLNGSPGALMPSGFLNLSGASLDIPIAGITLGNIRSSMKFTESGLKVDTFTMSSGPGSFNASGTVSLNGLTPQDLDLNARARQFRLANTDKYNLTADLDGALTGTIQNPELEGTFTVLNGFVYLDDFGSDQLEKVYLEDEQINEFSLYDSLAMDMQVVIERNFFVRNEQYLDLEIELTGELDATKKSRGDLSLFGSLEGRDGYVMPLNKLFTMEESSMTFTGPVEDPEIFVRSKHIPPTRQKGESVTLFYIIEGSAQEPEFRFDSEPYMEEQDIVCYTLFGKPCYSLESWQSVFADGGGTSAKDVLTDVLLDEVESLATRNLGVDLVQIDNTGTAGGTSITTGWYLNEKTFFAIINEITSSTPRTMFMLEYVLSETWDLILMQGDSNQRGIDFRYEYDY